MFLCITKTCQTSYPLILFLYVPGHTTEVSNANPLVKLGADAKVLEFGLLTLHREEALCLGCEMQTKLPSSVKLTRVGVEGWMHEKHNSAPCHPIVSLRVLRYSMVSTAKSVTRVPECSEHIHSAIWTCRARSS